MKFTVNQIAALLGGTIEGDGNLEVNDLSSIENGSPGTLSFLANPKYTQFIYQTQATCVLVSDEFQASGAISATLLRVKDPYLAFTLLLEKVKTVLLNKTGIENPSFIAEDALLGKDVYIGAFSYIGKGAKIGDNVKIFPLCYIGDNCVIGAGTVIYSSACLYYGSRIGQNCIVHSGAIIGSDGFGFAPKENGSLKKIPQTGIVVLEDEVEIGANATIDRATLGKTILKKGTKIDNLVQIAHNVEIGENTVIAAQTGVSGSAKIGKNAMIGGQVGIVGHIELADGIKIGAQSGVSKSVTEKDKGLRGSPAQDYRKQLKDEAMVRKLSEFSNRILALEEKIKKLEG